MAACGSLRHIFENTIPENNNSSTSSLIDSLSSWKHVKSLKPPLDHSFTEIFGELHFKENHHNHNTSSSSSLASFFSPPPSSSSSSSLLFPMNPVSQGFDNGNQQDEKNGGIRSYHCKSDSFSSLNSDSLHNCTEGLGSESLDDAEDLKFEAHHSFGEKVHVRRHSDDFYCRKKRLNGRTKFPPPIPYIGQTGKPSVSFESYRTNGRFVLKEVRIPTHECLQASREDGRLRLSFVQSNDDDDDDDDDDEDEDHDDDIVNDDDDDDDEDDDVEDDEGGIERVEEEENQRG